MTKPIKKKMIDILIAFLVVYAMVVALMFFAQRKMLYPVPNVSANDIAVGLKDYQEVSVKTSDGLTLTGFFSAPQDKTKPIVMVFHGNASHPAYTAPFYKTLQDKGYGILLTEYRGYGGNAGKPTEQGLTRDAEAYLNSDLLTKEYKDNPLIVYGRSLGSGVAVNLVSENPDRFTALILATPFDSVVSVVSNAYWFIPFPELLVKDRFHSDLKIDKIKITKLFILAKKDQVVGYGTGKHLYDISPEPKALVEFADADHNSINQYGAMNAVFEFIANTLGRK